MKRSIRHNPKLRGKRHPYRFPWLIIASVVACIGVAIVLVRTTPAPGAEPSRPPVIMRAAIVDQLYSVHPNEPFIQEATRVLQGAGFEVDLYTGDAVNVDLYRRLPSIGYSMIILRVHSGLLGEDPAVAGKTWLYTNEPYQKSSYTVDQLRDRLTFARTDDSSPWFFAASAKFFSEAAEGNFSKTAFIMMGCDCMHFSDMAEAFIKKGASVCIGWNASLTLEYVDAAAIVLMNNLCSKGLTVEKAVTATMKEAGPDPNFGAILRYYPAQGAARTLRQLIQ